MRLRGFRASGLIVDVEGFRAVSGPSRPQLVLAFFTCLGLIGGTASGLKVCLQGLRPEGSGERERER